MGVLFDTQGRAGKGVRCVSFNKNGATGQTLACACRVDRPCMLTVLQNGGMVTPMSTEDIPCQNLSDKGKPAVMAVLDDTVEEMILV